MTGFGHATGESFTVQRHRCWASSKTLAFPRNLPKPFFRGGARYLVLPENDILTVVVEAGRLADRLERPQTFLAKNKNGKWKVDGAEFVQIVRAVACDVRAVLDDFARAKLGA